MLLNSNATKLSDLTVISTIPEASGICFSHTSNTLFVANDEGGIYEIDTAGKILRQTKLKGYDLEGVACYLDKLYFAVEGKDSVLVVSKSDFKIIRQIKIKRKYRNILVLKKDKSHGLEGISIFQDKIYLSNQSYYRYPKEDSSIVFTIELNSKKKRKIKKIYNHGYNDVAGLAFRKNELYIVSDDENLLVNLNTLKEYRLPKFAQEGIAFDNSGFIYIADDEGRVLKGVFNE
jgi:uncharacterized protein YjiK